MKLNVCIIQINQSEQQHILHGVHRIYNNYPWVMLYFKSNTKATQEQCSTCGLAG